MPRIRIIPMPTEHARRYWSGGMDFHGCKPERHVSDGTGVPCRHCLRDVAAGEHYLILAYCPFTVLQPYAEVGPIFLHADPCDAYRDIDAVPAMYLRGEPRILRGYDRNDRIVYGTGKVVEPGHMSEYAAALLENPGVAYVHLRSSANNCFAFRVERGP